MSLNIEHKHFQSMIKVRKRTWQKMAFNLALICLLWIVFSGVSKQDQKSIEIEFPEDIKIDEANIYAGTFSKKIIDPKCIDMPTIIKESVEYKMIEKNQISRTSAQYWILLNKANEFAFKCIDELVKKKKINILFERNPFFKILKKIEPYKDFSEAKLIMTFDITKELIDYINASRPIENHKKN